MADVTTARVLAEKALEKPCRQECVEGMTPPLNQFEIADLRDSALREPGIAEMSGPTTIRSYARERLRMALAGEADLLEQSAGVRWYWPDATSENILAIIRERAERSVGEDEGNL